MRAIIFVSMLGIMLFLSGCAGLGKCPTTRDLVCGDDGKVYPNECIAKQAGVKVAYDGPCRPSCDDSDGGKDIFTAGKVTSDGKTRNDGCRDELTVIEYFCDITFSSEDLPCPAGYSCLNGKCVETPCSDSDGGIKPLAKGTAKAGSESGTDSCEQNGSLKEYFCEGSTVSYQYMDCPSGKQCLAGLCVDIQCVDSDEGQDKFTKGTTTKGEDSETDECEDTSSVKEYFCQANQITSQTIACGTGFECAEGACVELPPCMDSDGGKDKYIKGTVSWEGNEYPDDCYSSSQVLEYYCVGEELKSEKMPCGSGHECLGGECIMAQCQKDEDSFDNEDQRYQIASFGSSKSVKLYVGDVVELDDEMLLELTGVSGTDADFDLFLDYGDYQDNEEECSDTIGEGNSTSDMCGEDTGNIEVDEVNDTEDYAVLTLDDYNVIQIYSEEGTLIQWIGYGCDDDEMEYEKFDSYFHPYLDTDSGGLNLDGEDIKFLDTTASLEDIDSDDNSIELDVDGDTFVLEDGDDFEYEGIDYQMNLYFNEGGLYRMMIELD